MSGLLPTLIAMFVAYKIAAMGLAVAQTIAAISGFFAGAAEGSVASAGIGTPAYVGMAVAAVAALGVAMAVGASMAGDVNSPAAGKGKTQVSTKEGGLFELKPNDDLAAAPGLSAALAGGLGGGGNVIANVDTSRMERQNKELKGEMEQLRKDMASYFGFGGRVAKQIGNTVGGRFETIATR